MVAWPLSMSPPAPTPKPLLLLLVFCEYASESATVEAAAGDASDPSSELLTEPRCVSGDAALCGVALVPPALRVPLVGLVCVSTRRDCFRLDVLGVLADGDSTMAYLVGVVVFAFVAELETLLLFVDDAT